MASPAEQALTMKAYPSSYEFQEGDKATLCSPREPGSCCVEPAADNAPLQNEHLKKLATSIHIPVLSFPVKDQETLSGASYNIDRLGFSFSSNDDHSLGPMNLWRNAADLVAEQIH